MYCLYTILCIYANNLYATMTMTTLLLTLFFSGNHVIVANLLTDLYANLLLFFFLYVTNQRNLLMYCILMLIVA